MKTAGYFIIGLTFGTLIGGGIAYLLISDPKKRGAIIRRFFDDVESVIGEKENN